MATGLIALGGICLAVPAAAAEKTRSLDFRGELNYETFQRAAAESVAIRIKQSPGGTGAAAMVLGRVHGLVIDGPCNSACAWAFVRNSSACFTPRASFGFHGAHDPGMGRRLPAATNYWLSSVEGPLRARLSSLRTSSGVIRVSANQMMRYYGERACSTVAMAEPTAPDSPARSDAEALSTLSATEVQASEDALHNAAFDTSSVIVASLLPAGEGRPAGAEISVLAAETPDQPSAAMSSRREVIPSLAVDFPSDASPAWASTTIRLWTGVVSSTAGDSAGIENLAPAAHVEVARSDGGSPRSSPSISTAVETPAGSTGG